MLKKLIEDDCKGSCTDIEALSSLINQSVLVTGGTGFMGKWIAEIVCYLNTVHHFNIKLYLLARDMEKFRNEVPHLAKNNAITLLEQDVRNLKDLPDHINYIIHAAASPDNREHASQPLQTIEIIYKGTNAILDACFRLPDLKKIVHISSNYVYGTTFDPATPNSEKIFGHSDCNAVNIAYGESKRIAETLCSIYRNQQQLPITIVRPFAFIGPYQYLEKPWAVNNFIRDALMGGPVKILGNENTVRSYLYASDMAYWTLAILAGNTGSNVYNIGSQKGISLKELAGKIASAINKNIEIVNRSSKESYAIASISVPDISLVKKDLNVKETVDLEMALHKTIEWNQLLNKK